MSVVWVRLLRCAVVSLALLLAAGPLSVAQDRDQLLRDLVSGDDFRLRVTAALALGQMKNTSDVPALERALGDPHPAVRAAAAAALGKIGSTSSTGALKAALAKETNTSAKSQIDSTLKKLSAPQTKPKFVVQVGNVRNRSAVTQKEVTSLFRKTMVAQMSQVPGALVVGTEDAGNKEAKTRKLPLFAFDGSLTKLARSESGSDVEYSAKVEFVLRQMPDQALRGTVSGAAKASAAASSVKTSKEISQLQSDAIEAAVRSAFKNAPTALEAAAKAGM